MSAKDELVYVVERDGLFSDVKCYPQGFIAVGTETFDLMVPHVAGGYFMDRPIAEADWSMKQIIPYCLLTLGSVGGGRVVWLMQRKGGGEKRLEGSYYIGVGGHINPCDATDVFHCGGTVEEWALQRELEEELRFCRQADFASDLQTEPLSYEEWWQKTGPHRPKPKLIGLINDDSNPVGAVHLGMVYHLEIPSAWRPVTEDPGRWEAPYSIRQMHTGVCETWTQLIICGGAL